MCKIPLDQKEMLLVSKLTFGYLNSTYFLIFLFLQMYLITRIVTHTENKRKRQAVTETMREIMFAVGGKKKAVCVYLQMCINR